MYRCLFTPPMRREPFRHHESARERDVLSPGMWNDPEGGHPVRVVGGNLRGWQVRKLGSVGYADLDWIGVAAIDRLLIGGSTALVDDL
jgi:hypothetical protein